MSGVLLAGSIDAGILSREFISCNGPCENDHDFPHPIINRMLTDRMLRGHIYELLLYETDVKNGLISFSFRMSRQLIRLPGISGCHSTHPPAVENIDTWGL